MLMDINLVWKIRQLCSGSGSQRLDDFVDRLNHQTTTIINMALIAVTSVRSCYGKPIQCYFPQHYSRDWVDFIDTSCWITGTYYMPLDQNKATGYVKSIDYYQWIGITLIIQTLFFYLPSLGWSFICSCFSISPLHIMTLSHCCHVQSKSATYECTIQLISNNLHRRLKTCLNSEESSWCFLCFFQRLKKLKCGLFLSYLGVKVYNILNAAAQFYALKVLLNIKETFYGLKELQHFWRSEEMDQLHNFPRTIFCKVTKMKLGGPQESHLQCLFPMNLYLEKIYIFLWFYYLALFAMNCMNLLLWIFRMFNGFQRRRIVSGCLRFTDTSISVSQYGLYCQFVGQYLGVDGVFLLDMITTNTSNLISADIVLKLWNLYRVEQCLVETEEPQLRFPSSRSPSRFSLDESVAIV